MEVKVAVLKLQFKKSFIIWLSASPDLPLRRLGPKPFWIHIKKIYSLVWLQNLIDMVFCYQNCSDLLWEKIVLFSDREKLLKFEAEGREFAKCLRSIEQFILQWKVRPIFGTKSFLTYSWRFLRSNTLELSSNWN